jgi:hypothetical protein
MSEKIPYWIKVALEHKSYKEARAMIKRIGHLLPVEKRWKLTIKSYLPIFKKLM